MLVSEFRKISVRTQRACLAMIDEPSAVHRANATLENDEVSTGRIKRVLGG